MRDIIEDADLIVGAVVEGSTLHYKTLDNGVGFIQFYNETSLHRALETVREIRLEHKHRPYESVLIELLTTFTNEDIANWKLVHIS